VPLGRRDGTTASESEANNLPSPFEPVENITAKFISKGLEKKDVAVLSGLLINASFTFILYASFLQANHETKNFKKTSYPIEALRYAKTWGRDIVHSLILAYAKRLFPDSNP